MRCPGEHVQLGRDPGLLEAHRVVDVLVAEAVGPADHDERRREPRQVGRPRRRRGRRHVIATGEVAQHRLPAELVGVAVPHGEPVVVARRGDATIVEHGTVEQLEGDRQLAAIAGQHCERGGETATGAEPGDADAGGVDPEVAGVLVQPPQRGVAVLERGGVGVLGRQPVVDRYHDAPELEDPRAEVTVVHRVVAEHVATAVDPQHGGPRRSVHVIRSARFGPAVPEHAHRHVVVDVDLLGGHPVDRRGRLEGGEQVAELGQRLGGDPDLGQHRQHLGELGVDRNGQISGRHRSETRLRF